MQSASTRARSFLSWIKNWESLSELVTWILGIIGGFWLSPPIGTGESQAFVNATRFIVTVLIAVSIYFAVKFQKHHHARGWLIAAILGFSIFVGAWFLYDRARTKWICNVSGQLVVMGDVDTFTERGKDNSEKPECKRCEDLIFECGIGSNPERKAESIWEKEGIENKKETNRPLFRDPTVPCALHYIYVADTPLPKTTGRSVEFSCALGRSAIRWWQGATRSSSTCKSKTD